VFIGRLTGVHGDRPRAPRPVNHPKCHLYFTVNKSAEVERVKWRKYDNTHSQITFTFKKGCKICSHWT